MTTCSNATSPSMPAIDTSLSRRLDREWSELRRRPAVLARTQGWGLIEPTDPPLASLDDLLRRAGYRTPGTAATNAVFRRLLTLATDEPLAARIALQRILPGLLAIVRAEQRRSPAVDAFDLLIAEAWFSIIHYPTETRPDHIAARLLHDARHRAFTNPRRRRRVTEQLFAPHRLDVPSPPPDRSSFEELTTVLLDARAAGLGDRDLVVVRGILEHGSAARFATVLPIDARSVRYQRDRAVNHIRAIVQADQNCGRRFSKNAAIPSCASSPTAA